MKFILLLLTLVIISYGQLVNMHVWQDDNALFFKLAHISENAGYLSAGPFGTGAYKYIVTPHIPIYNLFGHQTVPYFIFNILLYFISAVTVYKVASKILGRVGGRVAGILYAVGFIASDAIIRIFNSALTSVSVILISFLTLSYLNFVEKKRIRWYFFSLLLYFLSVELIIGRNHYLIAIIFVFEILFFQYSKSLLKSLLFSLTRLVPFIFIFYKYFIENADSRSGNVGKFVGSILDGGFYQLFGFFSSIGNLFIPDWFTGFFLRNLPSRLIWLLIIAAIFISLVKILKGNRILQIIYSFLFLIWILVSREIFNVPQINPNPNQVIIAFLGGSTLILLSSLLFVLEKKYFKIYLLFGFWLVVNILAYSAYNPLVVYESINRYLAHSFFATVLLFATLFIGLKKGGPKTIVKLVLMVWGTGNLITAVSYQKNIVANRSEPAKEFYEQLKTFVPSITRGDVFYFDINESDRGYFNDAFSVASMPETTAIAWRYGVDRYDLKLFTNFDEFEEKVKNGEVDPSRIHSFWYSSKKLFDTSDTIKNYFLTDVPGKKVEINNPQTSSAVLTKANGQTIWENSEIILELGEGVVSSVPTEITFSMSALYPNLNNIDYPLVSKNPFLKDVIDLDKLSLSLAYGQSRDLLKSAKFEASSHWRERIIDNLHDSNTSTVWQPDRLKFRNKNEWFRIDIGRVKNIAKLVWINGFANNTPTKYKVEVSTDNVNWIEVAKIDTLVRLDDRTPQVISFFPINARFVRMTILESLNSDSPGIAEAWVVPSDFEKLDIVWAESFLTSPFSYITDPNTFNFVKNYVRKKGKVKVYWQNEGVATWDSTEVSNINLIYDGKKRKYSVTIPAGAETIKKIKLANFTSPTDLIITSLEVQWPRH